MSAKTISVLGATGSIGASTVSVIESLGAEHFDVIAVTGHANIDALADVARRLRAGIAVTADPNRLNDLRSALAGSGIEAAAGPDALVEAASRPVDWVMSAIVGAAGLRPTLAAVRQGATIALANKETLVAAGSLFLAEIAKSGSRLLPVDSEHNAIFQLVAAETETPIERLLLTASGGPFRRWTIEQMAAASPKQAVAHPNWSMGARISIDSASMFNKALEMIEAGHLFAVAPETIEVVVHPQSIIHSMVGYRDGSILAHLGPSDMRVAIGHALAWPDRPDLPVERLDFAALARLDFEAPDEERFPPLRLAREAMVAGGQAACILNAAHEVALDGFIAGQIGFLDMAGLVENTMTVLGSRGEAGSLEEIFETDAEARAEARRLIERMSM
ncbi:MAG: 1-deoxy-D-xylulose-5-phosphate reductoisomerase [Pseudomonadota bacterium]